MTSALAYSRGGAFRRPVYKSLPMMATVPLTFWQDAQSQSSLVLLWRTLKRWHFVSSVSEKEERRPSRILQSHPLSCQGRSCALPRVFASLRWAVALSLPLPRQLLQRGPRDLLSVLARKPRSVVGVHFFPRDGLEREIRKLGVLWTLKLLKSSTSSMRIQQDFEALDARCVLR